MDAEALNRLRARLPDAHLRQRLLRQTEHVAMRFDVRTIRFLHFYWENFDLMPKALGVVLKLTGLLERARRNALRYRVQEVEIPIRGLPPAFAGYRILHLSDLHIDEIRDGGESLRGTIAGLECDLCVLVSMMGGRLWVDSEPGRGSTFHFTVPFGDAEGRQPSAAAGVPPPAREIPSMDVLVVEDHPVNQRLALSLLEKWGHRATLARDGREGLDLLTTRRYDLVLMDMQMPEMGGLEATRRFRAQETGKRTPIVAMTANAMEGDRESCLAAGMDDYLPKPMRSAELLAVLERHAPVREINAGFDYAAALASEDREILEVVAQPFIDSFCRDITTLRNALAGGDRDTLRRTAHSIKGNSAIFGATPMVQAARAIEQFDPDRDAGVDVDALIATLEEEFERLRPLLEALGH